MYPFYRRLHGTQGRSGRAPEISALPLLEPWTSQPTARPTTLSRHTVFFSKPRYVLSFMFYVSLYTVHCNIILQYRPTKYTLSKLIFFLILRSSTYFEIEGSSSGRRLYIQVRCSMCYMPSV